MRIDMNIDQYEALTDLICFAYDNGYYHNRYNTKVFDDMADAVIQAKNSSPYSVTLLKGTYYEKL